MCIRDRFDAKKRVLPLELTGCIACTATMDGEFFLVGGKGDVKVEGGGVRGPVVASFSVPATSVEQAATWRDAVATRLKVQLLVKIVAGAPPWAQGNAKGYRVAVSYTHPDAADERSSVDLGGRR